MVNTLLWDYVEDNGGTIPYDIRTFTLRDYVEKYDWLFLEVASQANDMSSTTWNRTVLLQVPVNPVKTSRIQGAFIHTSFSDRTTYYNMSGKSFSRVSGGNNINGLVKIWGVKY